MTQSAINEFLKMINFSEFSNASLTHSLPACLPACLPVMAISLFAGVNNQPLFCIPSLFV